PRGFTYIPVPPGSGDNYAGLLTVDLPPGVVAGQVFTITIRRVATRRAIASPVSPRVRATISRSASASLEASIEQAATTEAVVVGKKMTNWRYVTGSFAVRIPVTT